MINSANRKFSRRKIKPARGQSPALGLETLSLVAKRVSKDEPEIQDPLPSITMPVQAKKVRHDYGE